MPVISLPIWEPLSMRSDRAGRWAAACLATLCAAAPPASGAPTAAKPGESGGPADLAYLHGNVYTVDAA